MSEIQVTWGYDVNEFSVNPHEDEVLLSPRAKLVIASFGPDSIKSKGIPPAKQWFKFVLTQQQ